MIPVLTHDRKEGKTSLHPGPAMNFRSGFKALKDWKHLGLNCLTLTLTPALSPGERGNSFPRIGNMVALDPPWFRGSMRERFSGDSLPLRATDSADAEKRFQRLGGAGCDGGRGGA